jgi:PAS domain S-box-containing protein
MTGDRSFRHLVEAINTGIFWSSPDGKFLQANATTARMAGYESVEEFLRIPTDALYADPRDREAVMRKLRESGAVSNAEIPSRRKDGSIYWISLSAVLTRDAAGQPAAVLGSVVDITERKLAEKALRESEERFRKIFTEGPLAMGIAGSDMRTLQANETMCRMLGRSAEEVIGHLVSEFTPPENIAEFSEKLAKLGRGEIPVIRIEKPFIRKGGGVGWSDMTVMAMRDDGGQLLYYLTMVTDVTERKQREEALRASERLLNQSQRVARLGHYVFEARSGQWTSSAALDDVFGIDEKFSRDVAAWLDLVHPEDRETMRSHLMDDVLGKKGKFDRQYKIRRWADGAIRWVHGLGELELDASGTVVRMFGTIQDVTESKSAQLALQQSQAKFAKVFESSPIIITISTLAEGRVVEVNDNFLKTFGYRREEVLGKTAEELGLYADLASRATLVAGISQHSRVRNMDVRFRTKDGSLRDGLLSAELLELGTESRLVTVMADVTEQRKAEEAHRKFEHHVQQAQRLESLGVLAGGIAHDFNNLLTGIFGFADLALASTKDAQVSEYLREMLDAMGRARSLTQQLLTFAKGGAPVLKVERFDAMLTDTVQFALSGSKLSCKYLIAPDLGWCNCDRNQMAQVIDNIVINAQQAMPLGGQLEITAANVEVGQGHGSLPAGKYVRISIADQGTGIPANVLPRIFDPFFTTKQKGTGLGLATCYSIVNRHGGCLEVESELGKGSTFHVHLPAVDPVVSPVKDRVPEAHQGQGTILLMDDEPVVRTTVTSMLARLGYEVVSVSNAEAALAEFARAVDRGEPFRAVILDLTVPGGMGGIEVAAEIRKRDAQVRLFVASGYADNAAMQNPRDHGFTGSLRKPFTMSELTDLFVRNPDGAVRSR